MTNHLNMKRDALGPDEVLEHKTRVGAGNLAADHACTWTGQSLPLYSEAYNTGYYDPSAIVWVAC